jgi:hypothetical protein
VTVQNLSQGFESYRAWATDPIPRIGFGMPWFDKPTGGGIARSEIAMLMAFSSVGKTTVALNIIRNNPHIPVLFFSLEMNWRMVAARLAAMELPSTTQDIETRLRNGEQIPELHHIANRYRGFVCDDTPAISLKQASESFYDATRELGTAPRLVVWDYLELIGGGGLMAKSEQVDKASQKLRDWARTHDCAVIVLHQVGKGEGGHEPLDLGSGRYGGFAPMDYVCGAYAPRLEKGITTERFEQVKEEIWFQLLKNRSGAASPGGKKYRQDSSNMRIAPWDYRQQIEIPNLYAPPEPVPQPALGVNVYPEDD